jgi:hypothetical protein
VGPFAFSAVQPLYFAGFGLKFSHAGINHSIFAGTYISNSPGDAHLSFTFHSVVMPI